MPRSEHGEAFRCLAAGGDGASGSCYAATSRVLSLDPVCVWFLRSPRRSVGSHSRSRSGAQLSGSEGTVDRTLPSRLFFQTSLPGPKSRLAYRFQALIPLLWLSGHVCLRSIEFRGLVSKSRSPEAMAFAGFTHSCQLELSKAAEDPKFQGISGATPRATRHSGEH